MPFAGGHGLGGGAGFGGGGWSSGPSWLDGGFTIDSVRRVGADPSDPRTFRLGGALPLDDPFAIPPMPRYEGLWRIDQYGLVVNEHAFPLALDDIWVRQPPPPDTPSTVLPLPAFGDGSSGSGRAGSTGGSPARATEVTPASVLHFVVSVPRDLVDPPSALDRKQSDVEQSLRQAGLASLVSIEALARSGQSLAFRLWALEGSGALALALISGAFAPWPVGLAPPA